MLPSAVIYAFSFITTGNCLLKAVEDLMPKIQGMQIFSVGTDKQQLHGIKAIDDHLDGASDCEVSRHYRKNLAYDDPWCNIYTSGTTGKANRALLSSDGFCASPNYLLMLQFSGFHTMSIALT